MICCNCKNVIPKSINKISIYRTIFHNRGVYTYCMTCEQEIGCKTPTELSELLIDYFDINTFTETEKD